MRFADVSDSRIEHYGITRERLGKHPEQCSLGANHDQIKEPPSHFSAKTKILPMLMASYSPSRIWTFIVGVMVIREMLFI